MEGKDASSGFVTAPGHMPPLDEHQKAAVLRELESVLSSHVFRTSERGKQFLSYVVKHTLERHNELLKERTIGVELFHRPPTYATGDDPVVRVKATEVRRRLAQYYLEESHAPEVRIQIPVGSYIPEFHWGSVAAPPQGEEPRPSRMRAKLRAVTVVLAALGLIVVLAVVIAARKRAQSVSTLTRFWAPVFSTSQPVLICLPSTVVYRPTLDVYRRYSQRYPTKFQTQAERLTNVLTLEPNATLSWKEMIPYTTDYVARDDAYVAAQLSTLFDRINKPSQVRNGTELSFEELRHSPAVLIGAFDNRWTLQMTADLLFVFGDEGEVGRIQEQKPSGRVWRSHLNARGQWTVDYAVVSRLFDSNTGQLLITAAGIGGAGTAAAGEFLSREDYLAEGLRTAPENWQKKNMQVVLETNLTDGIAGPPRVIATYFW